MIWTEPAELQFKEAFNYIKLGSLQNAEKFRADIKAFAKKLCIVPEIYSLDKYKSDNDGTYRAFEKHRYRVSYRFINNKVVILRIRHTSRKPSYY